MKTRRRGAGQVISSTREALGCPDRETCARRERESFVERARTDYWVRHGNHPPADWKPPAGYTLLARHAPTVLPPLPKKTAKPIGRPPLHPKPKKGQNPAGHAFRGGLPPKHESTMKFTRRENKLFKRAAKLRKEGKEDEAEEVESKVTDKVISREARTTRRIKSLGIASVRRGGRRRSTKI